MSVVFHDGIWEGWGRTETITNANPRTFNEREDAAPSLGECAWGGRSSRFEPSFGPEDFSVGSPNSGVSVDGDGWDIDVLRGEREDGGVRYLSFC